MADAPLDIDALLAWGRDYRRRLDEPPPPGEQFQVPLDVLKQYLDRADEALPLLKARMSKRAGGRPSGAGMGGRVAALIDRGARKDDAVRAIAAHYGKEVAVVRDALRRHRRKPS